MPDRTVLPVRPVAPGEGAPGSGGAAGDRGSPASTRAAAAPRRTELRWRKAALRLLVSGLLLGVVLSLLERGTLWDLLADFLAHSPGVWGLVLLAFLGLHAAGAWKWRLFLRLAGARLGLLQALRFYGSGLFANLCLPSLIGGDVLRAGLAMAVVEEKEAVLLGSIVDRFCDLAALALIVAVGAALAPGALDTLAQSAISGRQVLGAFVLVLVVGFAAAAFVLRPANARRLPRRVARHQLALLRAARALRRRPGLAALGLVLCLLLQTSFVLVNAGLGRAMGMELDLRLWLLLWPLAKIVAMMPISLGGLGLRELAFSSLVHPFGVAKELAVAKSLVWQSVLVAGGVLAGAFALLARPRAGDSTGATGAAGSTGASGAAGDGPER